MSYTACQIRGRHDWSVVLDDDGWWPEAVVCTDWECGARIQIGNNDE